VFGVRYRTNNEGRYGELINLIMCIKIYRHKQEHIGTSKNI